MEGFKIQKRVTRQIKDERITACEAARYGAEAGVRWGLTSHEVADELVATAQGRELTLFENKYGFLMSATAEAMWCNAFHGAAVALQRDARLVARVRKEY